MPKLAKSAQDQERPFSVWSVGCASGEEPYTLSLIGKLVLETTFPGLSWSVVATDADAHMLARARRACYTGSSFKELPSEWIARAFARCGEEYCLDEPYRRPVAFLQQDVRTTHPSGPFDLILCRYLVAAYYDHSLQRTIFSRMADLLVPGGLFILGNDESMPAEISSLRALNEGLQIYQKVDG
jgi:chemotaxis protein methyltransferase CheR